MNPTNSKKIITEIISSLSMLLIVSCSNQPVQEEITASSSEMNIVASIDVGEKGKIDFVEEEPGCLVVSGLFLMEDFSPAFQSMNPVELYEAFKGEKAPAALKKAFRKVLEMRNEKAVSVVPKPEIPEIPEVPELNNDDGPEGLSKTTMSAEDFEDNCCVEYCVEFLECFTNRSSDMGYLKNCYEMKSWTNSYTGSVTFYAYYWNGSSWILQYTKQVTQGMTWAFTVWGSKRWRYFYVHKNNSSDRFHFSVMGNYDYSCGIAY